jgi:hypothetical protein
MTSAIVAGYAIAICIATVSLKGLAPIARLAVLARGLAACHKNLEPDVQSAETPLAAARE